MASTNYESKFERYYTKIGIIKHNKPVDLYRDCSHRKIWIYSSTAKYLRVPQNPLFQGV